MYTNHPTSLLFYDYETFGQSPATDRPCQFAAIRTNEHLEIIDAPVEYYCKPPIDYLPAPEACLVHGITPQLATEQGLIEPEFIQLIHNELSHPGTCAVGYNSNSFDANVTRNSLYRNLHCPYEGLYGNGQSQWDILNLARACFALRPEGIRWPVLENKPSLRLEDLAFSNDINHSAHDALSDVKATLEIAKRFRIHQPKLTSWMFEHRTKDKIYRFARQNIGKPMLYISPFVGHAQRYCTIVYCIDELYYENQNPQKDIPNSLICIDLLKQTQPLFEFTQEKLSELLYTKTENQGQNHYRPPLYQVKLNHFPTLLPIQGLLRTDAERLGFDESLYKENIRQLKNLQNLRDKVSPIFDGSDFDRSNQDVDKQIYERLYQKQDKNLLRKLRASNGTLHSLSFNQCDQRIIELYFRYRGRYQADLMDANEAKKWNTHLQNKVCEQYDSYMQNLDGLIQIHNGKELSILQAVSKYAADLKLKIETMS